MLHTLAQGGAIHILKDQRGKVAAVECYNRDGWLMSNCTLPLFQKLRRRKAIKSQGGQPYRITRRGLELVRAEFDNR